MHIVKNYSYFLVFSTKIVLIAVYELSVLEMTANYDSKIVANMNRMSTLVPTRTVKPSKFDAIVVNINYLIR